MAETKKCPRCAESIKLEALVCRFCGFEYDPGDVDAEQNAYYRREKNKHLLKVVGILAVGFALYKACSAVPNSLDSQPLDTLNGYKPGAASDYTASAPRTWSYHRSTDDVSGKEIQFAELRSKNYQNFDFPYQGDTYLTIQVRKHPRHGQDVIFHIDRGQLQCNSYDGCSGMISIDGKAERLTLAEPADNSSEYVFALYDDAILRKLKGAKTIVVELPTFRNGSPSWTFESPGLVWPMP